LRLPVLSRPNRRRISAGEIPPSRSCRWRECSIIERNFRLVLKAMVSRSASSSRSRRLARAGPIWPTSDLRFFINPQKVVSGYSRLRADCATRRGSEPGMIGHRQWSFASIGVIPNHRNMLLLSDDPKAQRFQRPENPHLRCVRRKLGH
jgi:hypothetical protein